MQDHNTKAV